MPLPSIILCRFIEIAPFASLAYIFVKDIVTRQGCYPSVLLINISTNYKSSDAEKQARIFLTTFDTDYDAITIEQLVNLLEAFNTSTQLMLRGSSHTLC